MRSYKFFAQNSTAKNSASRNECMLIHGIEENGGGNTDDLVLEVINNNLGLNNIVLDKVQRRHRLGPSPKKSKDYLLYIIQAKTNNITILELPSQTRSFLIKKKC